MKGTRSGIFFVLSSPSGGGKTTIYKKIIEIVNDITYSVSFTTRKPRDNEIDGKDYHFIDETTFNGMRDQNQFVEWAEVHGCYYGTHKDNLQSKLSNGLDVILDIDVQGAKQLQQQMSHGVFIFIFPPSLDELEKRLRTRQSDTDASIQRRLEIARSEMLTVVDYDYLVINDDLEQAVKDIKCIIAAERCRLIHNDLNNIKQTFHLE